MYSNENNWSVGELVNLNREERLLKKSSNTLYKSFVASRFICIRERTGSQQGILVKVLGPTHKSSIMLTAGLPFCKDRREDFFLGKCYYGYPFPAASDVEEVLDIVRPNNALMDAFRQHDMLFDPYATFWVRDTVERLFLLKELQYYDVSSGQLKRATNETAHYRMAIVYFNEKNLIW